MGAEIRVSIRFDDRTCTYLHDPDLTGSRGVNEESGTRKWSPMKSHHEQQDSDDQDACINEPQSLSSRMDQDANSLLRQINSPVTSHD